MFTGIVEELGEVTDVAIREGSSDARVTIRGPKVTSDVRHGDSIAVNGVCLTVAASAGDTFTAELMAETLARTGARGWTAGTPVNLERSVTPTTRLGGHLVQGHVDGVGRVVRRTEHPGYDEVTIAVPRDMGRFLAPKGAVAIDGISLTVINVTDEADATSVTVGIIPVTRSATTMGGRAVGDVVNIEVDVMAKYAQRLLSQRWENQ